MTTETFFKLANKLLREEKLEDAVVNYRKAIDINPDFWHTYHNLGLALSKLGLIDQAIRAFRQAVDLNPQSVFSLFKLGELLHQQGCFDEAVIFWQRVQELKPDIAKFNMGFNTSIPQLAGIINEFDNSVRIFKDPTVQSVMLDLRDKKRVDQGQLTQEKLPITVLVITSDIRPNCLDRSCILAELVQRFVRHVILINFQFPISRNDGWRQQLYDEKLPIINLPGSNLPELHIHLQKIADRITPDVVIACKARLPTVELGLMFKERLNCPLIIDIDKYELSSCKTQTELTLLEIETMSEGFANKEIEPYAEIWTRLTQNLCRIADEIIVSNTALQSEFGGTIIPPVRDENTFNPHLYNRNEIRCRYNIPLYCKVILVWGTPYLNKEIDQLAQAVQRISDLNFRLLIVGSISMPDNNIIAQLDAIAPDRIIYLCNQKFSSIPEILSIADFIYLPQEKEDGFSRYQLSEKVIDTIAMGVPLLVADYSPFIDMIEDRLTELVNVHDISASLDFIVRNPFQVQQWQNYLRNRFLKSYSYNVAIRQIRKIIQRSLISKPWKLISCTQHLINTTNYLLGLPTDIPKQYKHEGTDVVVFWKQNDTGIYGRRHDMVIKYLASRPDIRKIIVFDAPISESDLIQKKQSKNKINQDIWIYVGTYEKLLGKQDNDKISYNVFVYPANKYSTHQDNPNKPHINEGYFLYLQEVFMRECVQTNQAVFWIYPKNYFAPEIIQKFTPAQVVVDVVDDHRSWPGVSEPEKAKLSTNYKEILSLADMVFANCEPVYLSMKNFSSSIRLVPNGCDSKIPIVEPQNSQEFDRFSSYPGKTIGYVGNLESKIDIELIRKLAEKFYDCQIVLIGSTHANPLVLDLKKYPNVFMPGVVPYCEVGAWVSRFNVGIVPHLNTELTKNMNPLKIFVYISLNVPVVSTKISNIDLNTQMVYVATSHDEFITLVAKTLENGSPSANISANYVATHNWENLLGPHIDEILLKIKGLNMLK